MHCYLENAEKFKGDPFFVENVQLKALLFCFVFLHFSSHYSNNPTHKYFLAVDPVSGALFISDTNSRRIYRVRSLTGGRQLSDNAEVVAGTGEQCLPFDERCGDGGKATEATLMSPKGQNLPLCFTNVSILFVLR